MKLFLKVTGQMLPTSLELGMYNVEENIILRSSEQVFAVLFIKLSVLKVKQMLGSSWDVV